MTDFSCGSDARTDWICVSSSFRLESDITSSIFHGCSEAICIRLCSPPDLHPINRSCDDRDLIVANNGPELSPVYTDCGISMYRTLGIRLTSNVNSCLQPSRTQYGALRYKTVFAICSFSCTVRYRNLIRTFTCSLESVLPFAKNDFRFRRRHSSSSSSQ